MPRESSCAHHKIMSCFQTTIQIKGTYRTSNFLTKNWISLGVFCSMLTLETLLNKNKNSIYFENDQSPDLINSRQTCRSNVFVGYFTAFS